MKRSVLVIALLLTVAKTAGGAESVTILSGGATAERRLNQQKLEMERATNVKLVVKVTPSEVGMIALSRALVDGVIGVHPDELFPKAEAKGMVKQSADDYQLTEVGRAKSNFCLNPVNTVKELTHEQVVGILSGKLTSWKDVNGQDLPINVYAREKFTVSNSLYWKAYLDGKPSPVVKYVADYGGLFRVVMKDPGALGLCTLAGPFDGMEPIFIPNDGGHVSYLIMRKNARPEAQKVFDYLKTLGAKSH